MNIDTATNPVRVVLDTNILISAIGFGGKPRQILILLLARRIEIVNSSILLAELEDVVSKKFPKLEYKLRKLVEKIKEKSILVSPRESLKVSRDEDDNRVLEAAAEGSCNYIITGDKDLLDLGKYKDIEIVTAEQFLSKSLL